jgi:Prealbumin-like fold domain
MANRLLGPAGRRRRRLSWLLPFAAVAGLVLALTASAGPIGAASGFEDDDGNLAVNSTFDWNGFSPVTWTGTAPYQTASKIASGWAFTGLTDDQKSNADTGFAGGTKQDKDCASVIGSSSPNKDDLKRIYLASKTVNGHVYLNLAWVRIKQNTTSPSAHVGFEFNQGTTPCGSGSDGLVQRTAGDMLIVYDFEGSSTDVPTLTVRRWVTSGACEISSDSPPCWGPAQNLTASGVAEARVNTSTVGPVLDTVAPTSETLGLNEFGEAGIDLTGAGIFQPGVCTAFGQAEGVSRSSGNSGQAAMEDLVGPGHINLSNCGEVIIIKHTDPRGVNQEFSFTSDLSGSQLSCSQASPETAQSFSLNDSGNTTGDSAANTQDCTKVPVSATPYHVIEGAEPTGFTLESLICSATGSGNSSGSQDGTNLFQANITIAAGNDVVTCVYTNKQQLGALKITKKSSKSGGASLNGAVFSVTDPDGNPVTGSPFTVNGSLCIDGLTKLGNYTVTEVTPPAGYSADPPTTQTLNVSGNNAKCSDTTFTGTVFAFTDTPLTDLTVNVASEASGGTNSSIKCVGPDPATTDIGNSPQPASGFGDPETVTANGLLPGTYKCTVVIDP